MRNKIIYYKPLIAGVALGALAAVSKDAWHVVPLSGAGGWHGRGYQLRRQKAANGIGGT